MKLPKYQQQIKLALTAHGRLFYLTTDQYLGGSLENFGIYSPSETYFLRSTLKPNWVCIDGGANHGVFTVEMARCAAKVIAAEPQPLMTELVKANVAINDLTDKVILHHGGLGSSNTTMNIPMLNYNNPNNYGAYSLDMEAPNDHKFPIEIKTIDQIVIDHNLPRVDFIKLDIEGMEELALRGALETITTYWPAMLIECDKVDKGQEVLKAVDSLNYDMYWLRTLLWEPKNPYGCSWENNPFGAQASFNLYCVPRGQEVMNGLPKANIGDKIGSCLTEEITIIEPTTQNA